MIKFFRHKRHDLIRDNKTVKYLKYAIGEIFLVVIGILIAVQINGWNESRKARKAEIKILYQLNIDLKTNLIEINDIKVGIEERNKAAENILSHLNSERPVTDSLKIWIQLFNNGSIFNNANSTYNNLRNSNENIITNDSLRLGITLMYEREFANIHTRENIQRDRYQNFKIQLLQNFKVGPSLVKLEYNRSLDINVPKDISNLIQNDNFKNSLVDVYNFRVVRVTWLSATSLRLEELIQDIDKEIKNLTEQ